MNDCPDDRAVWAMIVAAIIGLFVFFGLILIGVRLLTIWLDFAAYWQGFILGVVCIALPQWFFDRVLNRHATPRPQRGEAGR